MFPLAAEQSKQLSAQALLINLGCNADSWCINDEILSDQQIRRPPVYLVGDSNAEMFHSGMLRAARASHKDLVSRTHSSCPPIEGEFTSRLASCMDYKDDVMRFLAERPRGLVVLGLSDAYLERGESPELVAGLMSESIAKFSHRLEGLGHRVVVIEPIPSFVYSSPPFSPSLLTRLETSGSLYWPIGLGSERNSFLTHLEKLRDQVEVFDTKSQLCPRDPCSVIDEGLFVYRDANHITDFAGLGFEGSWKSLFSSLANEAIKR
jgi:hypothetical protein